MESRDVWDHRGYHHLTHEPVRSLDQWDNKLVIDMHMGVNRQSNFWELPTHLSEYIPSLHSPHMPVPSSPPHVLTSPLPSLHPSPTSNPSLPFYPLPSLPLPPSHPLPSLHLPPSSRSSNQAVGGHTVRCVVGKMV